LGSGLARGAVEGAANAASTADVDNQGNAAMSGAGLGAGLSAGLRSRELRFDDRPLAPHLTLARVSEGATNAEGKTIAAALEGLAAPRLELVVDEIAVVQSVLSPKGPRYAALATVPLAHN